ncbi:MAG: hypothetical protein ACHQNT_01570 [Bacteroidia bacterium]
MKFLNIKSFLLLVLFLLVILKINLAQDSTSAPQPYKTEDENKISFGQRLVFGGVIGLQFGDQTIVDIEPVIGYKITPQLIGGIGVKYIYYNTKYYYYYSNGASQLVEYSTNIYGGSVFGRYYFIENVFGHVEYEILNMEVPDDFNFGEYVRTNIASFLVGGGYSQSLGANSSIGIAVLYNLIEDNYSPYANPIIRIGFGFGF